MRLPTSAVSGAPLSADVRQWARQRLMHSDTMRRTAAISPIFGGLHGETWRLYCCAVRESRAQLPLAAEPSPGHAPVGSSSMSMDSLPPDAPVQTSNDGSALLEYVDKAIAYITRGDRFVVFEEPHSPAAGIQVPGGTVEPGESLEAAVLREAYEETGLSNLRLVRALGVQLHRRPSGRVHRRHYFHLVDESDVEQEEWEHYEEHPHSGSDPILYRLRWASLRKPPVLHAELDSALRQLRLWLTHPQGKRVGF